MKRVTAVVLWCAAVTVLSSLALPTASHAIEVPAILSGPTKVKDIISHFRSEMSQLIGQAGDESRLTLTRAYELMDDLLKSLEVAYADALDKTFADLDSQQQKAFQDAAVALDKFEQSVKTGTDAALQISTDVNTTINDVAVWATTPLVTKRGPIFIAPSTFTDPITFIVSGFKLARGEPALAVNGHPAERPGRENNQLTFTFPRSAYPSDIKKIVQISAALKVYKPSGFWCLFCSDLPVEYSFTQYVLPDRLGTFQHIQQTYEKKTPIETYLSPALDTGKTTSDNKDLTQCYDPPNGWSFVPNTAFIPPERLDLAAWWVNGGFDHRYNGGGAKITKDSTNQICLYVLARPTEQNTTAQTIARFQAKITQTQEIRDELVGAVTDLKWDKEIVVPYDQHRADSYLQIVLFDSINRVVKTDQPTDLPYLKVIPDERGHNVVLRPVRRWENDPR